MRLHGKRVNLTKSKSISGNGMFKANRENSDKVKKLTELMNNAYVSAGSGMKKKYTGKTFMI